MEIRELWRYPVKSMGGERLEEAELLPDGIRGDRLIQVVTNGQIVTARIRPQLLGFHAWLGDGDVPQVDGRRFDDPAVLAAVREATALPEAQLQTDDFVERFDVLPLTVLTDGGIEAFGYDHRRLRPNIVISGVDGLAEKTWAGRMLKVGGGAAYIGIARSRTRCVMTTFDPDTLEADSGVLRRIVHSFGGQVALDCWVIEPGNVTEGDAVELVEVPPAIEPPVGNGDDPFTWSRRQLG